MHKAVFAFLAVLASVVAIPVTNNEFPVPLSFNGDVIPGSYIVQLKAGVDGTQARALAESVGARFHKIGDWQAFSGKFSESVLSSLRFRDDMVEFIEADQVATAFGQQNNVPSWGLGSVSSPTNTAETTYYYPDSAGNGATVYIIDTGIHCTHNDFGGRCRFGARFGNGGSGDQSDGNGHGTHCGGTAVGTSYGIAKRASVVAVGVLGPAGSGSFSDVISGIEWSAGNCNRATCVGSLSLGGGASTAVDNAVNAAFNSGLFQAVAAGNSGTNAQNTSPARAANAYTVMAYASNRAMASYSNYGSVCNINAPGSSITSTWHTSNTASNTISGTSMATPHVAGVAAILIGEGSSSATAVKNSLDSTANTGTVSGVPSGTTNRVLFSTA
jgi:subtilisin family serine protease